MNPAFGVMHDQPIIEAEAQLARSNSGHLKPHYYIPPPPYAPPPRSSSVKDSTDSPATMQEEGQVNNFVAYRLTSMHK